MRKRLLGILTMLVLVAPATMAVPAQASPADDYSGTHFGENRIPRGCVRDMSPTNPQNICYHMRTGLNGLDSPKVDVLVLVPVSPTAERDMRIMRQSVEMWEGGIDYLAGEMGLGWLATGVDMHITVDYVDPFGEGGEFTTYPIVDPEIVVIATNPVGGIGIGVDPVDFVFDDEHLAPCHGVQNPFDFEHWESLPGFSRHHESRTGTYTEDCGGAGGNVCFAINGAIDPAPEQIDFFNLFDLVAHEFGHCLTLGHVGDGAEGAWGAVPTNDIMAYSTDPAGRNKCVSTLDVEVLAVRMSRYLDTNGDGAVNGGDLLETNDQIGEGGDAFQVQHPGDHLYASGTGSPLDCPQPDLGLVPGERTNWMPTPVDTTEPKLTVTAPEDSAGSQDGIFDVTGTVERVPLTAEPTEPTGSYDDADDDATTPITEILGLDVEATPTHVDATIRLADLWPSTTVASPTSYSLTIDGRKFDSFVRYPIDSNPRTWDNGAIAYMPAGTSTWDLDAKTVTFHIPRDYLAAAGITAPYDLISHANFGSLVTPVADDSAPEEGDTVGVAGARVIDVGGPTVVLSEPPSTVTFEHEGGNTFHPQDSTLGVTPLFGLDTSHVFGLDVGRRSDIQFTLTWTDDVGGTDLDLYVTGAADSGTGGATTSTTETVVFEDVTGTLDIRVEPFLVTAALSGSTYTLTATITPDDLDTDGDGIFDRDDACPEVAGNGADGCPIPATEHVHVSVDGALAASEDVDTANGADSFAIQVQVAEGTHELRVDWEDEGEVIASRSLTLSHTP